MALIAPKKTVRRAGGGQLSLLVAAGAVCIQGGLAILAAGYARPGRQGQGANDAAKAADALTYRAAGVFLESRAGGAADGDVRVEVQQGTWLFRNSAGADLLGVADLGKRCFIVDDETVAKTNPASTRAVAGVVAGIDSGGVMVDVGLANSAALSAV